MGGNVIIWRGPADAAGQGFDTQRLKMTYYAIGGDEAGKAVATNYGALSLYLDFINLFQFLLSFLGDRE
eukprot:gene37561-50705_t